MTEATWLIIAVILGIVHLLVAAQVAQGQRTLDWNVGPRDQPVLLTGMAGRLERAYRNFLETFPLFAAALLAVLVQGKAGGLSWWGAALYVVARIVYVPLYASGIKYVRTLAWIVAMVGLVMVVIAALK